MKAQTGIDVRGPLRWKSKREALQIILTQGGLEAIFDARFDRVPAALAQRGDIGAVVDAALGIKLLVIEGSTLVGPGETGLHRVSRRELLIAWSAPTARVPG